MRKAIVTVAVKTDTAAPIAPYLLLVRLMIIILTIDPNKIILKNWAL
jgi:hypothetical protein